MQKVKIKLVRVLAFGLLTEKTRSNNFRMCIHKIHTIDKEKEGIMKVNTKVKVIKKGAVKVSKQTEVIERKSKQAAAREMVSTVSNWVSDFQQRRREETKQAFKNLFKTPETSQV